MPCNKCGKMYSADVERSGQTSVVKIWCEQCGPTGPSFTIKLEGFVPEVDDLGPGNDGNAEAAG